MVGKIGWFDIAAYASHKLLISGHGKRTVHCSEVNGLTGDGAQDYRTGHM